MSSSHGSDAPMLVPCDALPGFLLPFLLSLLFVSGRCRWRLISSDTSGEDFAFYHGMFFQEITMWFYISMFPLNNCLIKLFTFKSLFRESTYEYRLSFFAFLISVCHFARLSEAAIKRAPPANMG